MRHSGLDAVLGAWVPVLGLLALLGGCPKGDCVTEGDCPAVTYATEAGNCLYTSPMWTECPDPHSICQGDCTDNPNGTCTYGGSSVPSKYCCGGSYVAGSLDCPDNQLYDGELGLFCGVTCQRPGSECCINGDCGDIGGVCIEPPDTNCDRLQYLATCPDQTERCCSNNQVCCADSMGGGAIGCQFVGFCQ